MGKSKHIPIRTCVICKGKFPKYELIRFTKSNNRNILSEYGGRGFYICPSCLSKRFIRIKNKFGIDKMETKEQLKKQIMNLIQLGWRSRAITIGFEDTIRELKKGKKGFLILAEDISDRTKRNILYKFEGDHFHLFTKDELGRFIGKREVGIIFVPEGKFGRKLKETIRKYLQIS
jgi:predicted RNA-binding protein YlxR (DUF448 family)